MLKTNNNEVAIFVASITFAWKKIALVCIYTFLVCLWFKLQEPIFSLPFITLGTVGTALAMLTAFRFRLSYDRWLDANVQWRILQVRIGIVMRQLFSYISQNQYEPNSEHELLLKKALTTLTAFPYTFHFAIINWRHSGQLVLDPRDIDTVLELLQNASEQERLEKSKNAPMLVLKLFCEDLIRLRNAKLINDPELGQIYNQVNVLEEVVGNCEKIKQTALPKRYLYLFNCLIYVFTFGIPWCLVDQIGYWSVFFTTLNFVLFYVLEDISRRTETPFGRRRYDLPTLHYAEKAKDYILSYSNPLAVAAS